MKNDLLTLASIVKLQASTTADAGKRQALRTVLNRVEALRTVVVQQRMNGERRQARRYWLSEGLKSFLTSPHAVIEGREQGLIMNLADTRTSTSRDAQLELLDKLGPDKIADEFYKIAGEDRPRPMMLETQLSLPHLVMPTRHDVRECDVNMGRLHGNLAAAADRGPKDFADLLLTANVGPRP